MEYVSYQSVSSNKVNLNTGSYLNTTDYSLFVKDFANDLWYGYSANDVIELGVYDHDQNQLAYGVLSQDKKYKTSQYSYINTLDFPVTYSYSELISEFILYKNEKILISPIEQVASLGLSDGSYVLTYNFTREMAGTPNMPLIVKEISPSSKEVKLVPIGQATNQYNAFCNKKILVSDVSPLYLKSIKNCPYGQIYNQISSQYSSEINTLKSLFFLNTDGAVVQFLKNIYEDLVLYTNPSVDVYNNPTSSPEKLLRVQGIRTYFSNFLMSNVNTVTDFSVLDANYNAFTLACIERKFSPIGKNLTTEHKNAKAFIYDFFTKYFYNPITSILSSTYKEKYYSYLRNAINVGKGRLVTIIDHSVLDERSDINSPLTLVVKLQNELPSDILINTPCWISNISQVPYVIDAIIKSTVDTPTLKIGRPNFNSNLPNANLGHANKSYTISDLQTTSDENRELVVSKKQIELNVNYDDFKNFVVFSSAKVRLDLFKKKIIQLYSLSSSLSALEVNRQTFLNTNGVVYPYYTQEYDSIQDNMNTIVSGFDGYESYLYRNRFYDYNGSFVSSSYISELDFSASYYDKNNRDSLVNNTPQHILVNEDNNDYLLFLSMIGHYFDELYVYISSLPSEKSISEGSTETFTRSVIDQMLQTFGWKLDDILEQSSLINNYLTSNEFDGLNSMSIEERVRSVRNRILVNLPQIYKTKGTEEAVKMLLSCYGIPSTLLSVREYGGVNCEDENASYTQYERAYMYQYDTSSKLNHFRTSYPGEVKTFEYKFSIPDASPYAYGEEQIQWGIVRGGTSVLSISASGYIHGGFVREKGKNLGKVFFSVGFKGQEDFKIYSDTIPIFDGNVYSVMIRKNDPDPLYQYSSVENNIPTRYDLYVQRNEFGRTIVKSVSSHMNYYSQSNYKFDEPGYLMIGGWFYYQNKQGYTGTFDKLMLWMDALPDVNFEDHVNNINSFSFSGSRVGYKSLIYRMHTDYPFDLRQYAPGTTGHFFPSPTSNWWGNWTNANPYYAASGSEARFESEVGIVGGIGTFQYMTAWGAWTGSSTIVYNTSSCKFVSQSIYPYQFKVIDYPSTSNISKYGPNRFRNQKVKYISQSYDVRFDSNARSTYDIAKNITPDSNLLGFFVDPQDFKNKDIVRYYGNYDFMSIIGSPSNAYADTYTDLRLLRKEYSKLYSYTSGSNSRFNEMMLLYKLYFNKSIFDSITNLVPVRSNLLTGVLIEPNILERPKYQSKPVIGETNSGSVSYFDITASRYFRDSNTKLVRITETPLYADFNIDTSLMGGSNFISSSLPSNPTIDLNLSYINDPSRIYPINYLKDGAYISDVPDKYQIGHFGSNQYLPMDGESVTGKISFDMNYFTNQNGSNKAYLFKKWKKYTISAKTGSWNRTDNPLDNTYSTSSVQLYEYVLVSSDLFDSLVYKSQTNDSTPSNISVADNIYRHDANTFKLNPNSSTNNASINLKDIGGGVYIWDSSPYIYNIDGEYFEIVGGYPRNHYIHKRHVFSPYKLEGLYNDSTSNLYIRSSQTIYSTIGEDGLTDGSLPVQSFDVSNINLIQSDNIINQ